MSLGRVQSDYGYRRVSYSGQIESVDSADLHNHIADDNAEVAKVFASQNNRLADHGILPDFIAPAKAGGLLIRSNGRDAEKILDVVFGVPALDRTPRAVTRQNADIAQKAPSANVICFAGAAAGRLIAAPMGRHFSDVVRTPAMSAGHSAAYTPIAA